MPEKARPPGGDRAASGNNPSGRWGKLEESTPNLLAFPALIITAEPNAPGEHGWKIVHRRGRRQWHRRSVALRSVARHEAAELAATRRWWLE